MSEEEIIEYFKEVISWHRKNTPDRVYALNNKDIEMIQGLLDLYNKEKEKNKKIEETVKNGMKNLWIDSCAEDSGKYSAYISILNILEDRED